MAGTVPFGIYGEYIVTGGGMSVKWLSGIWRWCVGGIEEISLPDEKACKAVNQMTKRAFCFGFCLGMLSFYLLTR